MRNFRKTNFTGCYNYNNTRIVVTSASNLPIVDKLLIISKSLFPVILINSSVTINTKKPIVISVVFVLSPPNIVMTVFTTAVDITPHAIHAAMKRVIPT